MKWVMYSIVVLTSFCVGCNTKQNESITTNLHTVALDSTSTEKIKVSLIALSPEAKIAIEDFDDFQNLKALLETMRTANPYYIQKYADSVNTVITAFKDNRSSRLKVNTIDSRITVLATTSALLVQHVEKDNFDAEVLLSVNKKLIHGYNSLVIQLNELSLAIPDNIREELLRDLEIVRDTIE